MMYKIQGTIYFRSDDGLMWLDEDASVTLTATTSRLLKFLLDHREHVIYRNEILEKCGTHMGCGRPVIASISIFQI